MPIRPENRELYPANWKELREGILLRANNQCEKCRAPNGAGIARGTGKDACTYMLDDGQVFDDESGEFLGYARGSEYDAARHPRVVLTIAHLDHNPATADPAMLRAWCQQCHLRYDAAQHAETRRRTREAQSGQAGLWPETKARPA